MAANTPFSLSKASQEGLIEYFKGVKNLFDKNYNLYERMRDIDLVYMREQNWDLDHIGAKISNRYGDASKYQDITVPIVMPQVETAVTYQASVFLTGIPLFGVVSAPKFQVGSMQLETIIDNQAVRGRWVAELIKVIRESLKYNYSALEVTWESISTAAIDSDPSSFTGQGKPKQIVWEGNVVKRLDPYNTIWDTRVAAHEVSAKGEFAGYDELISRMALKQLLQKLPDKIVSNINAAFESNMNEESFTVPYVNPDSFVDRESVGSFNWANWAKLSKGRDDINYSEKYIKSVRYARILPSEFSISAPAANTPQIWKFIIINNQHIIYAERQSNAHEMLPILMTSILDDGLKYQTKSFAENIAPIQQVSSALMNSVIAARRRAISDRTLYDPSLIESKHINSKNPTANIPVKASAYGKPIREAVFPFPFNDTNSVAILQELPGIAKYADIITGQNAATQGQFTKGNRTRHEFAEIQGNANGRNQLIALNLEAQLFTPLKEILKLNILQYQGAETIFNRSSQEFIEVDPVELRKVATEFKISDGLIPTDKLLSADAFQITLQTLGSSPELAAGYNVAPMFSYLMKSQGADITEFEKSPEQVQYEQALGAWQQAVIGLVESNPEIKPEQYPPQPKLEDFGLDEQGNKINKEKPEPQTIMQTVLSEIENDSNR